MVLGDIIRAANGEPVRSAADLYKQLDKAKVRRKGHADLYKQLVVAADAQP